MSLLQTLETDAIKIAKYFPAIVSMVQTAETVFPIPASGAQKLNFVLTTLSAVDTGLSQGTLTGLIAAIVTGLNATGIFSTSSTATK